MAGHSTGYKLNYFKSLFISISIFVHAKNRRHLDRKNAKWRNLWTMLEI